MMSWRDVPLGGDRNVRRKVSTEKVICFVFSVSGIAAVSNQTGRITDRWAQEGADSCSYGVGKFID